jgi:hypothetical protein
MFTNLKSLQGLQTFLTFGERMLLLVALILLLQLFGLPLPLLPTSLPLPIHLLKVASHRLDHPFDLALIWTDQLVHFCILMFDKVQSIISASGKLMGHFFAVLAPVNMENKFLSSKYVVLVEGATGLLLVLALLKHLSLKLPNII